MAVFKVTFKDPDALYRNVDLFSKIDSTVIFKYIAHKEYITVEFDTEKLTAKVLTNGS